MSARTGLVDRARAVLAAQPELRPALLAELLGITMLQARNTVRVVRNGAPLVRPEGRRPLPVLPASAPGFERGVGSRRDECAGYEACLEAWARSHKVGQAQCPKSCSGYSRADHSAELSHLASSRRAAPVIW